MLWFQLEREGTEKGGEGVQGDSEHGVCRCVRVVLCFACPSLRVCDNGQWVEVRAAQHGRLLYCSVRDAVLWRWTHDSLVLLAHVLCTSGGISSCVLPLW
jgi:hypothetical protein